MALTTGNMVLRDLLKALGLDPVSQPIRRAVLVVEVNEPVKVYIEQYVHDTDLKQAIEAIQAMRADAAITVHEVAGLEVSERGEVGFVAKKQRR